ncbi:MAG: hypothetical protein E7644_00330 [Ruminococcaceae bacterium]|nr:hypothetical protein [Oscillospiraceae bacterium]
MLQTTLLGLFGILLATSLMGLLWGGDRSRGPRGAVTLITGLLVLTLLLQPLLALFRGDIDLSLEGIQPPEELEAQYREAFEEALAARGEEDLRSGLYALLKERYQLEVKDAQIRIFYDDEKNLSAIGITLQKEGLLQDPRRIERDLENILECNVEVR